MVDAYEIGIELALQDGVSAGLEAVTKELAALDAAVAASSAGLMALVRTAGLAAEAVAAVGGVRVRAPASAEPAAVRPGVPEGETPGERRGAVVRDEGPVAEPGPVSRAAAPVDAGRAVAAGVERERGGEEAGAVAAVPAGAGAAPAAGGPDGREVVSREVERAPVVAPVAVVTRQTEAGASIPDRVRGDVPRGGETSAVPVRTAVRGEDGVTARVAPVVRDENASPAPLRPVRATAERMMAARAAPVRADVERALPRRQAAPVAESQALLRQGRAVNGREPASREPGDGRAAMAPVGSVERATQGKRAMGADQAVAPMRMAVGSGGGGGTVLLDGRLVGEWLMDRMARDAGRPGAGTTSFDPRQAPAWTPSGVV